MGVLKLKNNIIPKIFIILSIMFVFAIGLGLKVHAASDDGSDLSFYTRSSEVMKAFSAALAPSDDTSTVSGSSDFEMTAGGKKGKEILPGQAGGLLGYSDSSKDQKGITGWLTSSFSNSSSTFSYSQLANIAKPDGGIATTFRSYAYYGKALSDMGLDKTTTDGGGIVNLLFGLLLQGIYQLASLAPLIFKIAIKFLKILNPFMLFDTALNFGTTHSSFLGNAVSVVSTFYNTIKNLSLIGVIPIFFGLMIFSILVFRATKASNKIWRYVFRVFIIVGAIPLIGGSYTGLLNRLDEGSSTGSKYADYMIYSSFVDFEGWAKTTRLAPPNGTDSQASSDAISVDKNGNTNNPIPSRKLILKINALSHSNISDIANGYDKDNNIWNVTSSKQGSETANESFRSTVMDLLTRYTHGDVFTSSDYEGYAKAAINAKINQEANSKPDKEKSKAVNQMFTMDNGKLTDYASMGLFGGDGVNSNTNPDLGSKPDDVMTQYSSYSIYNAGYLDWDSSTGVYSTTNSINVNYSDVQPIGAGSEGAGLTPLAMYNYLNTEFNSKSMTVYSSEKASSAFVKRSHYSVVFAGGGIASVIGMISLICVLLCFTALSLIYAFGMLKVGIYSIPKIVTAVFGTTLGSIPSFAKLLVSTIVLILEIVGTMLLYSISESLVVSFVSGINTFTDAMGLTKSGVIIASATTIMINIFSMILAILVTWFSIKNRSKFVKIMEELANDSIKKIMGGLDNTVNNGNAFHDGGRGLNDSMSKGVGAMSQAGAAIADPTQQGGPNGQKSAKPNGVKQLLSESFKENNDMADKLARTGNYDKQTTAQKVSNSAEIFGRKMGSKLKDKGLDFVGLEGHNLERDREYAKDKSRAMDHMLMNDMQTDALNDIQGYNFSDDEAYMSEMAQLDTDKNADSVFGSEFDSGDQHSDDNQNGGPDQSGQNADQQFEQAQGNQEQAQAGESADDSKDSKSGESILHKPTQEDLKRATEGAAAGGFAGAASAVAAGRIKDKVADKMGDSGKAAKAAADAFNGDFNGAKDFAKSKILNDTDSKSDIGNDTNGKENRRSRYADKPNSTGSNQGSREKRKADNKAARAEVLPSFKRGLKQGVSRQYSTGASLNPTVKAYSDSLHDSISGVSAHQKRIDAASKLKAKNIPNYNVYRDRLRQMDDSMAKAKDAEIKAKNNLSKIQGAGESPDKAKMIASAKSEIQDNRNRYQSLATRKSELQKLAPAFMQQKGMVVRNVTNKPFTGNPDAVLDSLNELSRNQKLIVNNRNKADANSRKAIQTAGQRMSAIRNELSNSGFNVSGLTTMRNVDEFKSQFKAAYDDFKNGNGN